MIKLTTKTSHNIRVCDLKEGDVAEVIDLENRVHLVYVFKSHDNADLSMVSLNLNRYYWPCIVDNILPAKLIERGTQLTVQ